MSMPASVWTPPHAPPKLYVENFRKWENLTQGQREVLTRRRADKISKIPFSSRTSQTVAPKKVDQSRNCARICQVTSWLRTKDQTYNRPATHPSTNSDTPRVMISSVVSNLMRSSEIPPLYAEEAKPTASVLVAVIMVIVHLRQEAQVLKIGY